MQKLLLFLSNLKWKHFGFFFTGIFAIGTLLFILDSFDQRKTKSHRFDSTISEEKYLTKIDTLADEQHSFFVHPYNSLSPDSAYALFPIKKKSMYMKIVS